MVDDNAVQISEINRRIAGLEEEIEKARSKRRIANNLIDDLMQQQEMLRKQIMKLQGKDSNFGFRIGD